MGAGLAAGSDFVAGAQIGHRAGGHGHCREDRRHLVVITNFTTGPGATTLPILIWSKVKLGVTPDINALASIVIVIVGICVGIAGILMNRAEKRRERDIHLATAANE